MTDQKPVLPPLTPIPGVELPNSIYDILSPEKQEQLFKDLAEMARLRRKAEVDAGRMPLS